MIEEEELELGVLKELLLVSGWRRPPHVVVVVDDPHREERIVTIYEPSQDAWSEDYRRRR